MKILYVVNQSLFIKKFCLPEILLLKKDGWRVDVAGNLDSDVPEVDNKYQMPWDRNPFRVTTFIGIKRLKSLIEKNHYDIVYTMTPLGGLTGRLAVKKIHSFHPAVIYFCHGFHFFKGSGFFSWALFYPVEKYLSFFTDVLITLNREDYDVAARKFHAKEIIFSCGIGANLSRVRCDKSNLPMLSKSDFGVDDNKKLLFYGADIYKTKNQRYLLKVMRLLKNDGFNVELLLAGRDLTKGRFQRKIVKMGLAKDVKLLGFRDDCPNILRIVDCYVASSVREGLPLNVVEAMAAGVPVVAVDNRGHRELIADGKNGFLVSKKRPVDMKTKVEFLLSSYAKRCELCAAGLKTAETYDFLHVTPRLVSIYESSVKYEKK